MTHALKSATRPGVPARQPGHGLQGLVGPWPQRAACAGHPAAMEPATAWEAAFVILAYCDNCPALQLCDRQLEQEGPNASGVWAGQWLNYSLNPTYRRTVTPRFHDALAQISECERRAYIDERAALAKETG